jgi:hypothetical protein
MQVEMNSATVALMESGWFASSNLPKAYLLVDIATKLFFSFLLLLKTQQLREFLGHTNIQLENYLNGGK